VLLAILPGRNRQADVFSSPDPCVIEGDTLTQQIAGTLKEITTRLGVPFIFKASYDKANRSSTKSFRGPGIDAGLKVLQA
jgi:2-dehydro-3-deoxyphosphooctonate aldolase (KDO 8-P synthase)